MKNMLVIKKMAAVLSLTFGIICFGGPDLSPGALKVYLDAIKEDVQNPMAARDRVAAMFKRSGELKGGHAWCPFVYTKSDSIAQAFGLGFVNACGIEFFNASEPNRLLTPAELFWFAVHAGIDIVTLKSIVRPLVKTLPEGIGDKIIAALDDIELKIKTQVSLIPAQSHGYDFGASESNN